MGKRILAICSLLLAFAVAGVASAASSITVPEEARNTAALVRAEAREIADRAIAKAEVAKAEAALAKAEAEMAKLEAAKAAAELNAAKAEQAAAKAEEAAQAADAVKAAAEAEVAAAKLAVECAKIAEAKNVEAEAAAAEAAEAEAAAQAAEAAAIAAEKAAANEAKTDEAVAEAEAAADRAYADAEAKAVNAERKANEATAVVEAAEVRLALAEEKVDSSTDARDKVKEASAAVIDAQKDLEDVKADLEAAKIDTKEAKAKLAEAQKALQPVTKSRTFECEAKYYTWQDNQGHSGYQFYLPLTYSIVNNNMEYSLQTGYVLSENKSFSDGRVSTWTDTVLGLAYNNRHEKFSIRYGLDINLPNGKETLSGTHAIMDDDLVELSRFGEGANYTPGIWVSRKIGQEDTWTLGTYYSFRGSYTYDSSIPNGRIEPGNEWGKVLRWQHAGQKWQLVGELVHTSFGTTSDNGIDYREGNQFDAKLIYSREIAKDQNLMLYYWHSTEKPYSSSDPVAAGIDGTTTLCTQYLGAMWSRSLSPTRTFRITADVMRRSGNGYDPLTDLVSSGRSKYTIGIGYDIEYTPQSRFSIDIEQFYLKDNAPAHGYHGYNFYLKYVADL